MTNWNWETVFMVSTAALCGVTIGRWLARREILTQCRLLGGFYVGNTTVTVEKINGPDVYTTGGYIKAGQVPPYRPSSPPPGSREQVNTNPPVQYARPPAPPKPSVKTTSESDV